MANKKAKKKSLKKKDTKNKGKKKKVLKKKDSRKKGNKKKKGKKESKKKKAKKPTIKTAKKTVVKPAVEIIDLSSNYNVRDAVAKLRTLESIEEVQLFSKGENRLTVTKAIPSVIRRLEQ